MSQRVGKQTRGVWFVSTYTKSDRRDAGENGKTTGYYVPHHAETQIRQGVEAWAQLQDRLRELATLNKERLIPAKPKK